MFNTFVSEIEGIDGSVARLQGYVTDNSDEIDPERRRPAILILPGGAYVHTSEREAEPVALRMVGYGYQAFVLRYSCPPSHFPVSTIQIAEAMTLIRTHADEWHIDPDAIVVAGFSAGGHAAGLFAENWNRPPVTDHGIDPTLATPNGLMLGYPVITSGRFAHRRSIDNLLGDDQKDDPALLDLVSLEKHASADVPPTFLWTTVTDEGVPVQNSLLFAQALVAAQVNVEVHIYSHGRHGLSLGTIESAHSEANIEECVQTWPDLFNHWVSQAVAHHHPRAVISPEHDV